MLSGHRRYKKQILLTYIFIIFLFYSLPFFWFSGIFGYNYYTKYQHQRNITEGRKDIRDTCARRINAGVTDTDPEMYIFCRNITMTAHERAYQKAWQEMPREHMRNLYLYGWCLLIAGSCLFIWIYQSFDRFLPHVV